MALEDIEKELYSSEGPKQRTFKHEPKPEAARITAKWGDQDLPIEEKEEENIGPDLKSPRFKVMALVALFAIAWIIAGAYFFLSGTGPDMGSASVEAQGPSEVLLGVPFDVDVNYTNEARSKITDARIDISLPDGVSMMGYFGQNVFSKTLGDVETGFAGRESFNMVALKDEKTAKEVKVTLSYDVPGISSRFQKEASFIVHIGEPGVRLDITVPNKVLNGEQFDIDLSYTNTSEMPFDRAVIKLEYPAGFEFVRADLKPTLGNATWDLGAMAAGKSGKIRIGGKMIGQEGSFFNIKARMELSAKGETFLLSDRNASFAIAPSPLAVQVQVNGRTEYVARTKDALNYEITYKNNTDVGLKDVIVRAQLVGQMYDMTTIRSEGYFDGLTNTITFNASNDPELRLIPPGGSGSLSFSVRTKEQYPIKRLSDKNFKLKLIVNIESPTVPFFVAAEKTTGITSFESKMAGAMSVDAKALFRDAASGIVNSGPIPPRINTPTKYTVHWVVRNYATDMKDISIRANLQPGVKWTEVVKVNDSTVAKPQYNARTSEVSWNIDRLYAGRGIVDGPLEAIFQIEATPNLLLDGKAMPLIGETTLVSQDEYVGTQFTTSDNGIDTSLPDDPTIGGTGGRVTQ